MKKTYKILNQILVDLFHDILKTEEKCLINSPHKNISINEIHVIEAVCKGEEQGDNFAAKIASSLKITPGSLSVSVALLEKKGYLIRKKDPLDKRAVRIYSTEKGREVNSLHETFHEEMVRNAIHSLNEEEVPILESALENIRNFFRKKDKKKGD